MLLSSVPQGSVVMHNNEDNLPQKTLILNYRYANNL